MVMAKSGQCSSQKRHPMHFSGCSITGPSNSLHPMTPLGQNAAQILQALHQSRKMKCRYRFGSFLEFFPAVGLFRPTVLEPSETSD
jgi:hypothetical protein